MLRPSQTIYSTRFSFHSIQAHSVVFLAPPLKLFLFLLLVPWPTDSVSVPAKAVKVGSDGARAVGFNSGVSAVLSGGIEFIRSLRSVCSRIVKFVAYLNALYTLHTQTDVARTVTIRWLIVANRLPVCTRTTGDDAFSGTGIFGNRFRCFRST